MEQKPKHRLTLEEVFALARQGATEAKTPRTNDDAKAAEDKAKNDYEDWIWSWRQHRRRVEAAEAAELERLKKLKEAEERKAQEKQLPLTVAELVGKPEAPKKLNINEVLAGYRAGRQEELERERNMDDDARRKLEKERQRNWLGRGRERGLER